jgi:hypothetical protein
MKLLAVEEVKALVDELRRGEAGRTNSWDRHARHAAICALILRDKDLSIYERHFEMHQRYAMQFMVIANLERKLYEECQQSWPSRARAEPLRFCGTIDSMVEAHCRLDHTTFDNGGAGHVMRLRHAWAMCFSPEFQQMREPVEAH